MASVLYPKYLQEVRNGKFNFSTDDIRAIGYDVAYTPADATDEFLDDIPSGAILSVTVAALTVTNLLDTVDIADFTLPSVITGKSLLGWIFYQHTGSDATARLICRKVLATPIPTNGGDLLCAPSAGDNKVWRTLSA